MDPAVGIAGMVLILALAFALGYPFLARREANVSAVGVRGRQLRERKEQAFAAIKDLEFDTELGKVSAADYQRLRAPLEEEVLRVMHELDELNGHSDFAALLQGIETEVQVRRRVLPQGPGEHCPRCQGMRRLEDRFCPQCGAQHEEHGN